MPKKKKKAMTREELLKTIETAAREGWTELSLWGKEISELPDEIGELSSLERLDVSYNQLTSLPEAIGQLSNLQTLNLERNRLTSLPEAIGKLSNLKHLDLNRNQLTSLPEAIGQPSNLQRLYLDRNQLTSLPEAIGQLSHLEHLYAGDNQLTSLPECIGRLASLTWLFVSQNDLTSLPESVGKLVNLSGLASSHNQLTSLPESIGRLTNLRTAYLMNNRLSSLPSSLARLRKLKTLYLDDNPLNPALQSACDSGLDELRAYLSSLEEPAKREELYEAKLVMVGEGGVGKTTLLKAMTGQEPKEGEPTTHGVNIEIQALQIPHPDKDGVKIRLNAWDFGGQEVYRVTHQFFFSRRSIYLVVWEPRMGVRECQVEDWLKMIRLRVGEDARIIIVSTHCKTGQRIARIDKDVFQRDYGSMIVGFQEVDSLVDDAETKEKVGVKELKEMIQEAAKGLEQMGMEFNRDWREARDELLARKESCIAYKDFSAVCEKHGMDAIAAKTLADLMHDLGYIVYYGDDEHLKDDVVLQPEWLTKAIGFVLEDRTTQEMDGILPDDRLKEVWWDNPADGQTKFDRKLFPFFLRLMERFDVSYRLEDGNASLVAQHVPQVRPDLPWLPEKKEPTTGNLRIAMVCKMDEVPPGLVPWMIVRTHQYAHAHDCANRRKHRLHWQKGMFLRKKDHGDAMLELREREFHLYVEAAWPEFFMNVLRLTLRKLISDNWPGLEGRYYFAVPCRGRDNDKPCKGRFKIDALLQFLDKGHKKIPCQFCYTEQDIRQLLYGFVVEDYRLQLARIEAKLEGGFEEVQREIQGLGSRLANYVMGILQAIASEAKEGPRLFTVEPVDGNWKRFVAKRYRLHLWCEAEGCQHPVSEKGKGVYEFDATREWVKRVAPYANFIAGVLKTVLPIAAPAANVFFGKDTIDQLGIKDHLDLMKEATGTLLEGELEISDPSRLREGVLSDAERSGVLALHSFLREKDPNHEKLGLKRMATYTGDYLWLCEKHYEQMQPKIPEKIE